MSILHWPFNGLISNAARYVTPGKIDAVTGASPSTHHLTDDPNIFAQSDLIGTTVHGSSPVARDLRTVGRKVNDAISDLTSSDKSYLNWTDGAGNAIGGGSGSSAAAPVSDQYDYYNAKLASIYGMDSETAYREALSNTSYQRAVEDLKAAGLNPVLAAGKVSGADTFYGSLDSGASGGSSGGFSGGRSYSGASSGKNGLQAALKDYNVRSGVSSVVSGITMAATKNFQAGAAAYYFSNAILNAVSKR